MGCKREGRFGLSWFCCESSIGNSFLWYVVEIVICLRFAFSIRWVPCLVVVLILVLVLCWVLHSFDNMVYDSIELRFS